MTFAEFLKRPDSKKIVINEIDVPLTDNRWINYLPGIWFIAVVVNSDPIEDDNGNFGYYKRVNEGFVKIGSLSVNGESYAQVFSLEDLEPDGKTWFYEDDTSRLYCHFDYYDPVEAFSTVIPGAISGFTDQVDEYTSNYYDGVYYEPRIKTVPNLSKSKDPIFYGILQYNGANISYDNQDGYFDDFSKWNMYGQPIRMKLLFEGLAYSEAVTVYTGKVGKFNHNFDVFSLRISDVRKLLSRSLPVNSFNLDDYPDIAEKYIGTPVPILFGTAIKAPAYRISAGVWKFCDTEFLDVDSGITVYNKDDSIFVHGGTETDGTFTGPDTEEELTVSFSQSTVKNGLDVIYFIVENYQRIFFNSENYDLDEWEYEKTDVVNTGLWIGQGHIKKVSDVIEGICVENNGVFDVLADGRFTFRSFDPDKEPTFYFKDYQLLQDPIISYNPDEFLSSVRISHSQNLKTGVHQLYSNTEFTEEVYSEFKEYKNQNFETNLSTLEDAVALSNAIMDQSKTVFPEISLITGIEELGAKILDNAGYEYARLNGKIIQPESSYQIIGINLNLSTFEMSFIIKFIKEIVKTERVRYTEIDTFGTTLASPVPEIRIAIIEEV